MFKVGDEVLVKAQVVDTDVKAFEGYNHKVQFWDSINNEWDWVSESAISGKTYTQGLADAWELAKKIVCAKGGMPYAEIEAIFGSGCAVEDILLYTTAEEALAKVEAYEKEKEIKVGDVVYGDDEPELFGVVTLIDSFGTYVMWVDGSSGRDRNPESLHKTGKHIDIESLLRQIGE